ncbi:hypothetical protein AB0M39_41485 [Streptomyces sp. NPDC051907]|uniref:hypothetical protein n=1 Tax=Streptomyces sp. NPDC051907 TaxID=3155284 RepID=UPI0034300ABC
MRPVLPSPTRETITEALAALDGGPVSVGPLAFRVCEVLGVDTSEASGSYDLRRIMSWSGLEKELRHMTADGALVVRSQREWHDMTWGLLFPDVGRRTIQAYATGDAAAHIAAALGGRTRRTEDARRELARRKARARVLLEHRALVDRYTRELLADDPLEEGER